MSYPVHQRPAHVCNIKVHKPICRSPLAYGGPSWKTNSGPLACSHYFKYGGQIMAPIGSVCLTCQWYRSSHVRAFNTSSLSGCRLSGNEVLGRRSVCVNALLSCVLAAVAAAAEAGVLHVRAVHENGRHCECGRRRESSRQARM